jgi:hypothetical protein
VFLVRQIAKDRGWTEERRDTVEKLMGLMSCEADDSKPASAEMCFPVDRNTFNSSSVMWVETSDDLWVTDLCAFLCCYTSKALTLHVRIGEVRFREITCHPATDLVATRCR